MKGTRHNGRSGKDGVYNPLHNDRRFDPEHSEHIDNERVRQNIYWDCYQGYTTMADRGKEDNFSFNQIEMAYYVDHYSDYVINQNKRHEKARHPDRCKGVEDVLKNKKTCPEESIYQLGTIDEHASVETLVLVFDEFKKEFDERFGSNVHIIDWSLHMDEATPHIHERHVFDATNRYGEIEPKQEAALEELGFELPNPEKKRSKTNNRTLRIEDVENLLDEVSSEAYDKAVDKVAEETMRATRKDDIRLAEDSKRWIQSPERKASRKEKEYAINRLDGLIKKIEYAMEKAVVRVVRQLKQPEKKKAVVEEIKKEVKPSIREKLALNVAKIQREEAERKQLNKGRSHSSDLEL